MSRSYIANMVFKGDCTEKLRNKLISMGLKSQIISLGMELGYTNLWIELGASGGIAFEDVLNSVMDDLKQFKLNWDVFAYSLHPDNAYIYDKEKREVSSPE